MAEKLSLIWHASFEEKLKAAIRWSRFHFGERTAGKFYRRIIEESNRLTFAPYIGGVEPLLDGFPIEYRSLVVHKHFKVVYYVDEANALVHIVDMWDVRREPTMLRQGFDDLM